MSCSHIAFPSFETVCEGGVGNQHGHICTCCGFLGDSSLQHSSYFLGLCHDFFLRELALIQDIKGCSLGIESAGLLTGTQVFLQLVAFLTGKVIVLLQILICLLNFLLVSSVCIGTRPYTIA